MGMYAHIRTKNEIEYSNKIGDNGKIIELVNNLYGVAPIFVAFFPKY